MSEQGIDRTSHPRPETQQDPIPTYRAYTIGPTGHIIASALLPDCTDDLAAINAARRMFRGYVVEVWDRARFITKIQRSGDS